MFSQHLVFAGNTLDSAHGLRLWLHVDEMIFKITFFPPKYSHGYNFNLEKLPYLGRLQCFKTLIQLTFFSEYKSFNWTSGRCVVSEGREHLAVVVVSRIYYVLCSKV